MFKNEANCIPQVHVIPTRPHGPLVYPAVYVFFIFYDDSDHTIIRSAEDGKFCSKTISVSIVCDHASASLTLPIDSVFLCIM